MTPKEFLQTVWPDEGFYCLATPFKIPGTDRTVFRHKTFDSIAAAAQYADNQKNNFDIFFAVLTLKKERVWNPDKLNAKTGEPGAWETRKQSNMLGSKCFFFDLDVEADNPKKYATQAEALQGLIDFCAAAKLPKPLVTSSGGGLHVYWVMDEMLPADEWRSAATKLKQVAKSHGLKFDPMRTTDASSVLRVAGTYNLKKNGKRAVKTLTVAKVQEVEGFLKKLDRAVIEAGAEVPPDKPPSMFDDLGSNIDEPIFNGPPVSMKAVLTACAQMRYVLAERANLSEPQWYHSLNLVRFVEKGDVWVHRISDKHPGYNPAATDAKVAQLQAKNIKPTSCTKLAEVCGEERCAGCAFAGKVKSPIVAARWKDPAPAPVVQTTLGLQTVVTTIPEPPAPYTRMKDGKIAMIVKNKDGDEIPTIIYENDIYPVRRLVNDVSEVEQQVWRVIAPRSGAKDFVIDADALYDRRKFMTAISNHGIYPKSSNISLLQDYMIAYISELQRLADADAQCNHLGWTEEKDKFILPDKIVCADGSVKPASLSVGAQRATAQVQKKGTLQRQVELMQFYNHDAYIPHQYYVLQGLGAVLMYMTGHHGIIVNATGEPGASKSTALYTAASFWGQPELYPINGTNSGATVRGRNERITTLANLPICVDEITNMPQKDAIDLAMSITQPGHRIRLTTEGVERNSVNSYKATIMLTTANSSLHTLISTDDIAGTAGSMRVFEIQFNKTLVHSKPEADDYLHALKENYGHIGEVFTSYVIQNRAEVEKLVREAMRWVDEACGIQPSERFWSASVALTKVACVLANKLGLLPYSEAKVMNWALNKQIPYMRGVVIEEYSSPISTLSDYLEAINNNMVIIQKTVGFGSAQINPVKLPQGALLARYEASDKLMWVSIKPFKDWCIKHGLNHRKIIEELSEPKMDADGSAVRVVINANVKKVLGAGTDLEKGQSRVFSVNMNHPEIRDLELNTRDAPERTEKPNLKLVK